MLRERRSPKFRFAVDLLTKVISLMYSVNQLKQRPKPTEEILGKIDRLSSQPIVAH